MSYRIGRKMALALVVASMLAVCGPVSGIVVLDDPALHETDGFEGVCALGADGTGGTGVLVAPGYVLTVGHLYATSVIFTIDGVDRSFNVVSTYTTPDADLRILKLGTSTGMLGYNLWETGNEEQKIGVLVGYGVSGVGAPDKDAYPVGTKRFGYNKIDYTGLYEEEPYLFYDFDHPLSSGCLGADKEAMIADKDSGGGLFIEDDDTGELLLAGIHCLLSGSGGYGSTGYDVQVKEHADWILDNISIADFNRDGVVNGQDFLAWNAGYGTVDATRADGDANHDGIVNGADFLEWNSQFGSVAMGLPGLDSAPVVASAPESDPVSAPVPLPEPMTVSMLMLGGIAVIRRRSRIA